MKFLWWPFVVLSLIGCAKHAEKEIFYIPNGYVGTIIVIFGQKTGVKKEYDNTNARVYRVPENGVLYTEFARVTGILDQRFCYVSSKGELINHLPTIVLPILEETPSDSSKIFAMIGFDGEIYINSEINRSRPNHSNENAETIKYIYFFVGTQNKIDSLMASGNNFVDQTIEAFADRQ